MQFLSTTAILQCGIYESIRYYKKKKKKNVPNLLLFDLLYHRKNSFLDAGTFSTQYNHTKCSEVNNAYCAKKTGHLDMS